jgi:hypothetical protein
MATTLNPGSTTRYGLQPGESLSIVTDANSTARYALTDGAGTAVGNMINVPASTTVILGQGSASRWLIDLVVGPGVTVTQNGAQGVPDLGAPMDLLHLYGAGAPSAATGANQAAPGSLYTDTTNAKLYIQGGTKVTPSWKIVTSA